MSSYLIVIKMKKGTAYFGNKYLYHAKKDLLEMKKANCNVLLITYSENDMDFYKNTVKDIIKEAHELDMEVYVDPWGLGKVFGGEAYSNFIAKNIDAMEEIENREKRPIACLNNGKFKSFMKEWIKSAKEIGGDYIFFDEPHFYIAGWFNEKDHWGCRCNVCQNLFKKEYGYIMPEVLNSDIEDFKINSIYNFLEDMCGFSQSLEMKNNVCFLPAKNKKERDLMERICSMDSISIIGTDPYWIWKNITFDIEEYVGEYTKLIKELSLKYNKESEIWVQNFFVKKSQEKDLKKAYRIVKDNNIDRLMTWAYRGSCCMSTLACEDSEQVWKDFSEI